MTQPLLEEAGRAYVAWIMGDTTSIECLVAVAELVETRGALCGWVVRTQGIPEVVTAETSRRESATYLRIAAASDSHRSYATAKEKRWSAVVGDASFPATWFASEPISDEAERAYATLVVASKEEGTRDEILNALPQLARATSRLFAREHAREAARKEAHGLRNNLAVISANVDYASTVLDEILAPATEVQRADVRLAMKHAREVTGEMRTRIDALVALAGGRR